MVLQVLNLELPFSWETETDTVISITVILSASFFIPFPGFNIVLLFIVLWIQSLSRNYERSMALMMYVYFAIFMGG